MCDADQVDEARIGYLLSRDPDARPPRSDVLPQLSAMLAVSADVGAELVGPPPRRVDGGGGLGVVGGTGVVGDDDDTASALTAGDRELRVGARTLVAEQLRVAAGRVSLTTELLTRLGNVGRVLGVDLTRGLEAAPEAEPTAVLVPGARVCFTGSALDDDGVLLSREQMELLARRLGLETVANVTKTKCDVLIVAEPGTQSTKARSAAKWGKPILSVADFLDWARGQGSNGTGD